MTTVVHCKKAPYDVYIGRANGDLPESKWANPWVIGIHGTREEVILRYEGHVRQTPNLMAALPELCDKVLGCWCKGTDGANDVPCHGDVLVKLLNETSREARMEVASQAGANAMLDHMVAGAAKTLMNQILSMSGPITPKRDILCVFDTAYSYGQCTLTLEEAGKTRPGNPVSVADIARENHLKQVVVVSDRIDGVLEGVKNLAKPFKPTAPKTLAEYVKEEQGEKKTANDENRAKAQKLLDEATAKYEREKAWSTDPIQLVFGLKMTVVPDMNDKSPASETNESSVIVFMKDAALPTGISPSYLDLIKINNLAWTKGKHKVGRIDWKTLKEMWTPNLVLALPFFSSFIARNLLTFATIVPDLSTIPWVFKEVESQIPFAPLIEQAIDQFAASSEVRVQEVKTVYYRDSAAFKDYTIFRASRTRSKGKSGTFSAPGVDNLSSDQFSFEAWRKLVS